tara:strand:+ start:428 stop:859 length:432 start_codon:yes stop_codon:yes gene_type:complete
MKLIKYIIFYLFLIFVTSVNAGENFFEDAKNLYEKEKYKDSKFLFQRNIVFNPKDSKSYIYLAKIYKLEENENETKKYLNTALLLEPDNEEAMYMLIDIELERSNFSKVKELKKNFEIICSTLCEKKASIDARLKKFEKQDNS